MLGRRMDLHVSRGWNGNLMYITCTNCDFLMFLRKNVLQTLWKLNSIELYSKSGKALPKSFGFLYILNMKILCNFGGQGPQIGNMISWEEFFTKSSSGDWPFFFPQGLKDHCWKSQRL